MKTKKEAPAGATLKTPRKDTKNSALKRLKSLYLTEHYKKYPSIPPQCRCTPTLTDKTANGLTKCILTWLKYAGWQAERINVTGIPTDHRRIVHDCLGRARQIGSVQWRRSGSTKGSADISATIAGRSVKIEVKAGKDQQSAAQKKYQGQIEAAGGIYIIARNFDDFLTWYDNFLSGGKS